MSDTEGSETASEAAPEPEVLVLPTFADAAQVAAERIATSLSVAVARRGVAHWVTTGGSTPGSIYRQLSEAPLQTTVPWDRVHLWWGDERWVSPEDILSNALACWDLLLRNVPVPLEQIHVMPIGDALASGDGPEVVAAQYAAALHAADLETTPAGFPRLDVVLVGIGSDGHVLSVFPGSSTWDDQRWVQAVPAPDHIAPHVERITLHPRILDAARLLVVVAHGAAKAPIIGEVFGPRADRRDLPALLARRGGAVWIIDAAAGAALPSDLRGTTTW